MKIKILAFGIAKDILGNRIINLEIPAAATVGALKEHLEQIYPDFKKLRSLKLAVNQEYVDDGLVISDSDEIVIIPPVSGG
ncbi:MAG: MoaD/ThiS family protein [Saprospiraceae bacterium]|nr:MoaD/ThiS family protein [Saprospiraceae bacterium]